MSETEGQTTQRPNENGKMDKHRSTKCDICGEFMTYWLSNYIGCYGVQRHFQKYFSYNVAISFIGGENRSTRRKPPNCRKSLTDLIK